MKLDAILEKMWFGNAATNEELEFFIAECKPVAETLIRLGEKFHLSWAELNRTVMLAETWLKERKEAGVIYIQVGKKVQPVRESNPQQVKSSA